MSPFLGVLAGTAVAAAGEPQHVTAAVLKARLAAVRAGPDRVVQGVTLDSRDPLLAFYAGRSFSPAWNQTARTHDLLETVVHADLEGLGPDDYLAGLLADLAARSAVDPGLAGDLEILLTESLLRYATHRRFGKIDANALFPDPLAVLPADPAADAVAWLERASAAPSLGAFLAEDLRDSPLSEGLKLALSRYRALELAGGWPAIRSGPTLQTGDRGPRVAALRQRLAATGDLEAAGPAVDPELFDSELRQALQRAQVRHGLAADGRAGRQTVDALDLPIAVRIGQLRLAIERMRWIRNALPNDFILVNIPAFHAEIVRDGRRAWESRVIVGQRRRPTPILRAELRSVVINPNWTVPPTIVREDVLPQLQRDPGYLERENLRVVAPDGGTVDPATVDWSRYTRAIPYKLVQDPGPRNALGRVKFMIPNDHTVYMHDTPGKALFEQPARAFSSGCIRVEEALGLARLLLADVFPGGAALDSEIASGKSRTIKLGRPTTVLLVYSTAAVDPDMTPHFYPDIYAWDRQALAVLEAPMRVFRPRSTQRADRRSATLDPDAGP